MRRFFLILWISIQQMTSVLLADEPSVDKDIADGDLAYQNKSHDAALEAYGKALKLNQNNYEATWKLSRAYTDVSEAVKEKEKRQSDFKKAYELSQKAIELNPNGAKG